MAAEPRGSDPAAEAAALIRLAIRAMADERMETAHELQVKALRILGYPWGGEAPRIV